MIISDCSKIKDPSVVNFVKVRMLPKKTAMSKQESLDIPRVCHIYPHVWLHVLYNFFGIMII